MLHLLFCFGQIRARLQRMLDGLAQCIRHRLVLGLNLGRQIGQRIRPVDIGAVHAVRYVGIGGATAPTGALSGHGAASS